MRNALLLFVLASCSPDDPDTAAPPAALDLAAPLGPGEVRAGVITDEAALLGGISAEGAVGDVKIYNQHVAFVIQGLREGHFYVPQAGNVVDADVVRPAGQPGRDLVDEWLGMAGLGRLLQAERVTVVSDGRDGGPAIVRAEGYESPLELLTGAVETPALIPDLGLEIVQEYRLAPDSWLLEVTTTYTATTKTATFSPGDGILGSADAAQVWRPGTGYAKYDNRPLNWAGWVGKRDEGAVTVLLPDGLTGSPGGLEMVGDLFEIAATFTDLVTLEPGASHTFTRSYGVGPDLATITAAHLAAQDLPTEPVEGTVTAPDGPVAGARVAILLDGEPYTLAFTGEDGTFATQVPAGHEVTVLADGRGDGWSWDHPEGAGAYSPYAGSVATRAALDSLANGAVAIPSAEGRGAADPASPLTLGEPAWIVIASADGLPFETRVRFTGPDPAVDARFVRARASGYAAAGASRDGAIRLAVEPGTYEVLVHRGARYEAFTEVVTVAAGEETALEVELAQAFEHPGWLFGDPHCHASPSPDASIAMEDRLVGQAGAGVQLHFGTDHDHVGDYRPLIEPLGLSGVLATVVASEMSPVMRGHKNVYPLEPDLSAPNHGAWPWWRIPVETTSEEVAYLRDQYGGPLEEDAGFALQINHPVGPGMADIAQWSPGEIGRPDFWADDFDAMEVLNGGDYAGYLPVWLDLVARGYRTVPTGVTDSHAPFSGDPGLNATYFGVGTDDPAAFDVDALRRALLDGKVVVSRGVFLDGSIDPGAEVVGPQTWNITARSPSWVKVDRLLLLEDGVEVERVEGATASFTLDPAQDALYVVIAEGDTPMAPVYPGQTPWAMTNAVRVDVDGEGWDAPLPPLVFDGR